MKYYIKLKNMYLKEIYVCEEYPYNNFISHIEFVANKDYCNLYDEETGKIIIDKLIEIGFMKDQLYLKVGDE